MSVIVGCRGSPAPPDVACYVGDGLLDPSCRATPPPASGRCECFFYAVHLNDDVYVAVCINPSDAHCCHMGTAIKHRVPTDQVSSQVKVKVEHLI